MRESFDLLSRAGRKNLWRRGFDAWALRFVIPDTWGHVKCLLLGHRFTADLCGSPWCQRCYMVRRKPLGAGAADA
jgi:hypothetical protein